MFKHILFAVFGMSLAFGAAASDVLSDLHSEMGGCEACHANGEPSEDGAYEVATCVDCHGGMQDMPAPHPEHDGILVCTDCHNMHEDTTANNESSCKDCH